MHGSRPPVIAMDSEDKSIHRVESQLKDLFGVTKELQGHMQRLAEINRSVVRLQSSLHSAVQAVHITAEQLDFTQARAPQRPSFPTCLFVNH